MDNIPIIEVRRLEKKYDIAHMRGGYIALRDVLATVFRNPFGFMKHKARRVIGLEKKEEFWALKDINFTVRKGEIVGIIGANGAGKSTLLKILSQITPPTKGEVILRGKVGSLLEVGTGFHPELTGRENIFLNGAILGMKQKEIEKKFNQIVGFAGIEKFLDTPVKRYSSGMYVRLAFSVAAHMEPDILIIDEVLAVGDAEFQKKCLGKIEKITKDEGRTILFVSHNMSAITRLCSRAILLNKGVIAKDGPVQEVIDAYLHSGIGPTASKEWPAEMAPGNGIARLMAVQIKQHKKITNSIDIRLPVEIEMEYEVVEAGHILSPNYHFYNEEGLCVFVVGDHSQPWNKQPREKGRYVSTVTIPGNLLSEGTLRVTVALSTLKPLAVHFNEPDVVAFHITDSFDGTSARGSYMGKIPGVIRPLLNWTTKFKKID